MENLQIGRPNEPTHLKRGGLDLGSGLKVAGRPVNKKKGGGVMPWWVDSPKKIKNKEKRTPLIKSTKKRWVNPPHQPIFLVSYAGWVKMGWNPQPALPKKRVGLMGPSYFTTPIYKDQTKNALVTFMQAHPPLIFFRNP